MFKKTGFFALLSSMLVFLPISSFAQETETNYEELLKEDLSEISDRYELDEILSEEDANLIKAYAIVSGQNNAPTQTESYSTVKTIAKKKMVTNSIASAEGDYTTQALLPKGTAIFDKVQAGVGVRGTCSYNFITLTHKYSCGTTGYSSKSGVTHKLTHDAYAPSLSGELQKKYTETYTKSSTTKNASVVASDEYFAGLNVWMTFTARATSNGITVTQTKQ